MVAYNEFEGYIGSGRVLVDVPSNTGLSEPVEAAILIENPLNYTGKGTIKVDFEISMIDYSLELGRVNYG